VETDNKFAQGQQLGATLRFLAKPDLTCPTAAKSIEANAAALLGMSRTELPERVNSVDQGRSGREVGHTRANQGDAADAPAYSGTTAVTSISTLAASSISALTSTAVIATA